MKIDQFVKYLTICMIQLLHKISGVSYGICKKTPEFKPVSDELLGKINAYWRAANYLSAGQLYLLDNPLLRKPLTMEHVKKKIVGHGVLYPVKILFMRT